MHLLDLIYEFEAELEFTGDNECDYNELTINRFGINDVMIREVYKMSSNDLDNLKVGLRTLSNIIDKYTQRETN